MTGACRTAAKRWLQAAGVMLALLAGVGASQADADSASLHVFTRPDGRTVGTVKAQWSSCSTTGDCSWQVGVLNSHQFYLGDQTFCFDQPWWEARPHEEGSSYLTWLSPVQSQPGTLSLSNQPVTHAYLHFDIGPTYCLYVRAASNDYQPQLIGMVYYPVPTFPNGPPDASRALLRLLGRYWQYSTYHYMACGGVPPEGGRAYECNFDWRNGKSAYFGTIAYWPLDGGRVGRAIRACPTRPRKLAGSCTSTPSNPADTGLYGGASFSRQHIPKALRDPGGPFASFPTQTLPLNGITIPVTVRCELPADLVCRGTVRLLAAGPVTLGSARLRLRGKQRATVPVTLGSSGRRELSRHMPAHVRALAIPYTKWGTPSTGTLPLR